MPLYQLMYISTATPAVTIEDCHQITARSATNNLREDVTGLLLFNSKRFLQVLEGPKDAVERVFDRVSRDDRHRAVVKLREAPITEREFGRWAMAFDDPAAGSDSLSDKVAALLAKAGPSTSAHFIGSAQLHGATRMAGR